ncbi:MAG: tetratricopeptide repeat protein, partial [bacterium]
ALGHYRAATREPGDSFRAWEALAGALYRRGDFAGAREAYEKVSVLKPEHVEAWLRLGSLSLKLGLRQDAQRAWGRALELEPSNTLARGNLAALEEGRP